MNERPELICSRYDMSIIVQRWAALAIDIILRLAVIITVLVLTPQYAMPVSIALCAVFYIVYYPLLEGLLGQTFGKWVCQIRVVDANGESPGLVKGILRTVARVIEIDPFLFGGLPAGIVAANNPKRQRLGDMLAGTFVVRKRDLNPGVDRWRAPYQLPVPAVHGFDLPMARAIDPRPIRPAVALACCGGMLLLPALSLINAGVEAKRHPAAKSPTTITCEALLAAPVKPGWYHVTGVPVNLAEARCEYFKYESSSSDTLDEKESKSSSSEGAVTDVYIPVKADPNAQEATLVIATKDHDILYNVAEVRKVDKGTDREIDAWLTKNMSRIVFARDFTGMIEAGSKTSDFSTATYAGNDQIKLAPAFRILREGGEPWRTDPQPALNLGAILGIASAVCLLIAIRKAQG